MASRHRSILSPQFPERWSNKFVCHHCLSARLPRMADFNNDLVHESLLHSASFRYSQPLHEDKLQGMFVAVFCIDRRVSKGFHKHPKSMPQPDFLIAPLSRVPSFAVVLNLANFSHDSGQYPSRLTSLLT
ncbi:hypothetical protein A6X21_17360 [Planctopirus hydrillae]|uniref:Uncharacterized protein n=1 Tax=Planctopirus hydrillae TaxID=1841610 RepID=A0A1C3EMG8_9PLAN|nr:hypothetical protein A6X21_17360 [Planctopirus hydrillae]